MVFTSRLLPLSLLHAASVPHRTTLTSTSTPNVTARPSTAAGLEGTLNSPRKKAGRSKTPTKAGVSQVRPSPAKPMVGSSQTAAKPRGSDCRLQSKSVEKSTKKKQGEGKHPATPTRQCSVLLPQGGWSCVLINHTPALVLTLSPFTSYMFTFSPLNLPLSSPSLHFPFLVSLLPFLFPLCTSSFSVSVLLPFISSLPLHSPPHLFFSSSLFLLFLSPLLPSPLFPHLPVLYRSTVPQS